MIAGRILDEPCAGRALDQDLVLRAELTTYIRSVGRGRTQQESKRFALVDCIALLIVIPDPVKKS